MSERVRLEALEALEAIAHHGSFAAAAAALYRVPSAVSYTVARMEAELGVAVFDRSGHRAVLTPAGRLLLDEGRRILTACRELGSAARRMADAWEPELRIAADGLIAPAELWPTISAFHREHPAIDVRLAEEVLGGTWEALIDERVDLAIGIAEPPTGAGIQRQRFRSVNFVFCCAPGHPLAALARPLAEDTVRAYRAVVVADSARRLSPRSAALLDGQRRLTVANMYSKIAAIEQGLGVGHCPRGWVAPALADGRLVAPALDRRRPPIETYLLWRQTAGGRALAWFIERLGQAEPGAGPPRSSQKA